jgi:GNAT superfamily N-acetyltransferase
LSEIRRATIDDLAAIEHIVAEAFAAYVPRMGMRPAPMDDDHGARIAAGEVEVFVDAVGIAGVLVLVIGRDEAKLEIVAVAERVRGRGLGRRLVAHAEAVSRAAGCLRISLFTHETMTENRAIYPRLGYVETHRARQDGFDRVFFSKTLAPLPGRTGAPTGGRG